jgi:uncharacterized membrane protein YfcA
MGGAFVALPILTSRYIGLTQNIAHGTSMLVVLATSIGGIAAYSSSPKDTMDLNQRNTQELSTFVKIGDVDVETALTVAFTASLFAIAGAKVYNDISLLKLACPVVCDDSNPV